MRVSAPAIVAAALAMASLAAPSVTAAPTCHARVTQIDFGRIDAKEGGYITGRLTVTCDGPTAFEVSASAGYGNFRERTLTGPKGTVLRYNLYVDPARRRVWGDGEAAGTARISGQSDGRKPVSFTVHGRLFKGQEAGSGRYRDTVEVSVSR